jgi:hypothetical protein
LNKYPQGKKKINSDNVYYTNTLVLKKQKKKLQALYQFNKLNWLKKYTVLNYYKINVLSFIDILKKKPTNKIMVLDILFSNYSFFIFSYYKDILLKKIQLLNFKIYQLYFEQILMIKNNLILNVTFKSVYSIKYHQLFLLTRGFLKTYSRIFFF